MNLSTPLYDTSVIEDVELCALAELKVSAFTLMQRASLFALSYIHHQYAHVRSICILVGSGKNAGDGYLLAQHALSAGFSVNVFYITDPSSLADDVKKAYLGAKDMGVQCEAFKVNCLEGADLIVDALLGTGIDRGLSGEWLGAVMAVNKSRKPIISLDVPSGLDANTGAIYSDAIKADVTITFVGNKPGLYTGEGPEKAGKVVLADLGIPQKCFNRVGAVACSFNLAKMSDWFPKRKKASHKGDFGRVLIVGGQPGMGGSVLLCGESALRTGAGLVSIATHPSHASVLMVRRPELMVYGVESGKDLDSLIDNATCIIVGCGLGTDEWGISLLKKVLTAKKPMVLDADALNLIAYQKVVFKDSDPTKAHCVVTPHPREASRLLGIDVLDVEKDRLKAARSLSDRFGVAVLKGAGSLVSDSDLLSINTTGNPGMASAGMGDVLSGIIAGLIVQGVTVRRAARLGVWLHGLAGDLAAKDGEHAMIASDVIHKIRYAIKAFREHEGKGE